jgi:fibronectin-binding autotransporter adhesin
LSPANYSGTVALTKPVILNVASGTATISGSLSGSTGLIKDGNGSLILSGVNTYAGNTSVVRGRLQISNDNQLGNAANNVTVTTETLNFMA